MPPWNPVYNMTPTAAPGIMGLPYMVGGVVAPMVGGVAHPYIGPNQAIADAYAAQRLNDPNYRQMLSGAYGQLGYQLANTIGGMGFINSLANMTGYEAGQIRQDLAGFGRGLGRSMVGAMVMPAADQMLNAAGVTGGSFLGAVNAIYANRMALMSPGVLGNPYDAMQQRASAGAASAMMQMLNGLVSKATKDGMMTASPEVGFTKGFGREQLANLAMRMAGAGMFSGVSGGFAAQLQSASGLDDIGALDWSRGDFKHLGASVDSPGSIVGAGTGQAQRIRKFTAVFANRMRAGVEAMGAMRDFLHEIDGLEDKLTALTGGEWLRSAQGAMKARDAVNRLNAVAKAYNIDPNAAMETVGTAGFTLQAAALGGADAANAMRAFGFDGGGMFRVAAQTELLAGIEDMISARGVRGDPVLAGRLRAQGVQAAARNMNTQAGIATQVLAWAHQRGALTDSQYRGFADDIETGDQSVMGHGINRMLATVFGSAQRGRELMQDQMFVQRMRQDMDGQAGQDAMRLMMSGAEREFAKREEITAAGRRMSFATSALAGAGMSTAQTPAGVAATVATVARMLDGVDKDAAAAFREQYDARVARGASPNSAFRAVMAAFRASPATGKYAQRMELAATQQNAGNSEDAFIAGGRESGAASAMARFLRQSGAVTGAQSAEIYRKIRAGDGAGALALAERYGSALSPAQAGLLERVRADANMRYETARQTIDSNRQAEALIGQASSRGLGSDAVSRIYNSATALIDDYRRSGRHDTDRDLFLAELEKTGLSALMGDKAFEAFGASVAQMGDQELRALVRTRGRHGTVLAQLASEQLRGYGYGFNMSGYFGGGKYAMNNKRALDAREAAVRDIVDTMDKAGVEYAGDRQTLAQDLIDWAHGDKSLLNAMKVYGGDGGLYRLFKDGGVVAAREAWSAQKAAYGESAEKVGAVLDSLRRTGGAGANAAAQIEVLLGNAENMSEDAFEGRLYALAAASGGSVGLKSADVDRIRELRAAKVGMVGAATGMDAKIAALSKRQDVADAYGRFTANREYAERRRSVRDADALRLIGDEATADRLADTDFDRHSALGRAYKITKKIVTDDEVARRLGYGDANALEDAGISGARIASTRLSLLKEKYGAGDADAIDVMRRYRVAAQQDKAVPVKGTLIIKSGRDQETGVLEGDFGGM